MKADLEISQGEGGQRKNAARLFLPDNDLWAAAADQLGGVNCGECAELTLRHYGPSLKGNETIHVVHQPGFDHAFNIVQKPGHPLTTLDAWANGPAMQTIDTAWHTSGLKNKFVATLDSKTGRAANEKMKRQAKQLATNPDQPLLVAMSNSSKVSADGAHVYGRSNSLAESQNPKIQSFGKKSRYAMRAKNKLHQEILAVGAIRLGYHRNVAVAAAQAPAVVKAAQTLETSSRLDPQTKQRRLDAKYAASSKEFVDGAEPAEGCRSRI